MPSVSSNGPNWIRRQKARTDRDLEGLGPVRRFLAKLFGRDPAGRSEIVPSVRGDISADRVPPSPGSGGPDIPR